MHRLFQNTINLIDVNIKGWYWDYSLAYINSYTRFGINIANNIALKKIDLSFIKYTKDVGPSDPTIDLWGNVSTTLEYVKYGSDFFKGSVYNRCKTKICRTCSRYK